MIWHFFAYVSHFFSAFFHNKGFGVLSFGSIETPSTLQHVELNYVEQADCGKIYELYSFTDAMMCAGEYGKDGCQGDSGERFNLQWF